MEIKVKALLREVEELCTLHGFRAVRELPTADGSRIDLVIFNGDEKVLAIEFENSFKWIRIVRVYPFNNPFNNDPLSKSWVEGCVKEELGVELVLVKPVELLRKSNPAFVVSKNKK